MTGIALIALTLTADYAFWACGSITKGWIPGQNQKAAGLHRLKAASAWDHIGYDHPYINAIAYDPRDPSVLYLASGNGLIRAKNFGNDWRIMTGWDMTEAQGVAIDPFQPDRIFLALPDGIGYSEDSGQTWTRREQGLKRKFTQVIRPDRTVQGRVVAGTESGIFVSNNNGLAWHFAGAADLMTFDVAQSPHDARRWIAVTQDGRAFESLDGALTWKHMASVPASHTFFNAAFDRKDSQRIALAGWSTGVIVSDDSGKSWQARVKGLPTRDVWRVQYHPENGELYAYVHERELYASTDNGRTWKGLGLSGGVIRDLVFVPLAKGGSR